MMAKHGQSPIDLIFQEVNNKFKNDNKAMSNIEKENLGRGLKVSYQLKW